MWRKSVIKNYEKTRILQGFGVSADLLIATLTATLQR
jgi:hypothetical protein